MENFNLYDVLPGEEVDMLYNYIGHYGDETTISRDDMKHFLRYWAKEKMPLYRMLGDQFIVKKEIRFDKDRGTLKDEIYDIMKTYHFSFYEGDVPNHFIHDYQEYITKHFYNKNDDLYNNLNWMIESYDDLLDNIYRSDSFVIPAKYTLEGREIQVTKGCKLVKILGKIAKAFGIDRHYEAFRQAHSQVLNQKRIGGTLCLSIHPLDYATMSDNECGWSSCMSWMEGGDYRLGTIEMMNSPCVVVAYIESSSPMAMPYGYEWNSKKWRQLYIITPELILGNRQYPFANDEIQGAAINWLRELATVAPGYGPYGEEACEIRNHYVNTIGERQIRFTIQSNYMYNDVYDTRLSYFSTEYNNTDYFLNFSGVPVCTGCGCEIELNEVEANFLNCPSCNGVWRCHWCDEWCDGEPIYVNDVPYCHWCYENELEACPCCEEIGSVCYGIPVHLICGDENKELQRLTRRFNGKFSINVCNDCFYHASYIGGVKIHRDDRGTYIDLEEITPEAMDMMNLHWRTEELLVCLMEAKSDEERIEFLDKLLVY
jgi:hypothetical protein